MIPDSVLKQHSIALGKTRSGKSSAMRFIVEKQLDHDRRVCIIDPKGDWFGIKSSSDGKRAGYPVVIFGGEHADVPLNQHAGAHVAELIATGNRPSLIDLGGWHVGERTRFYIDFAATLFRTIKSPLLLVIDECHNFCPQGKIMDPDAGKMLHWSNRLASEGGGKGIILLAASQRPQKVHKDFVTSMETLFAFRVIHPLDRNAMKDWIDGCPDREKGKEVLDSLASMPRGEAWVWSPEAHFGPKRVTFPMFKTFDSFAAPTGEATTKLKGWAEVDLDEVRTRLSDVVKESEANDPKLLRRQIADLQKQLADRPDPKPAEKIVEKPVLKEGQLARIEKIVHQFRNVADDLFTKANTMHDNTTTEIGKLFDLIKPALAPQHRVVDKHIAPTKPSLPLRYVNNPRPAKPVVEGNGTIGNSGLRRILIALAQRPGLTNRQLGLRACLSSKSGTFGTYLSKARTEGWLRDEGDRRFITDAGVAVLGAYEPLPEGPALLAYWLGELGTSGAGRMLQALVDAYPQSLTNEELGEAASISHTSGTFGTYMSKLRTLELVEGGRGSTRASEELFG